jgi:ABC-type antimicrobial peptide transport system permease subunit
MVYGVGSIPGIIVIVIIISIMNHNGIPTMIASMIPTIMIIMIMMINRDCHNSKGSPIRRWSRRRIIRHING